MLSLAAVSFWIAAALTGGVGLQFGDSSVAAVIAAVASVMNALILWRAKVTQDEIAIDVKKVKDDTDLRQSQIEELRSLSMERNRQILRMERLAERFEAIIMPGGKRYYDPETPAEGS